MNWRLRWVPLLTLAVLVMVGAVQNSWANSPRAATDPPPACGGWFGCDVDAGGIETSASRQSVLNLPKGPGDDGKGLYQPAVDAPRYEYGSTTSCVATSRPGESGADVM